MERREFLKSAAGAALASVVGAPQTGIRSHRVRSLAEHSGEQGRKCRSWGWADSTLDRRALRRTWVVRIVRTALDSGINFLDNCWDYNDGESERRMGRALRDGYRQKAFLMTKIDGRTAGDGAAATGRILTRLQTDHIDLIQVHEVIRMNDPERVFAPGGAMETLEKARKAGKVRFIGFTGHKSPAMHLHMIEVATKHNYNFDTVQMPVNVMDAHVRQFCGQGDSGALAEDGYSGDEEHRRRGLRAEQDGQAGGVPALRDELRKVDCVITGLRFHCDS